MSQISPTDDTACEICEIGENFTAFAGIEFTWGLGGHKITSPIMLCLSGDTMIF